ncbi:ABC transporter permease [Bacillus badius]|uniref:ABC transporter permease n=1 Tax=Bacillus badius TaxID=1455 RepID=UPI002E20D3D6|nr:ABC transporter permease [Bacillus badius]
MFEEKRPFYTRSWFVIFSLIMFFPLGLILMWKFKKFNQVVRAIVTVLLSIPFAFVSLAIILGSLGLLDDVESDEDLIPVIEPVEKNEASADVKEKKKESEKNNDPAKNETDEEKIVQIIHKAIGKKSLGNGEDRIIGVRVNENFGTDDPNDKIVLLNLMADNGFTKDSMKYRLYENYVKLAKKVFEDENVSEFVVFWEYPLVDVYGNSENGVVMKVMVSKETASYINWGNFNPENIPTIADDYFEHPSMSR